ncbi:MAG: hypothetical protein GWP08_08020 [Nitrospiraceae bacterium]|nr:hypothetical protein [Nitrospiraceae bacterium]
MKLVHRGLFSSQAALGAFLAVSLVFLGMAVGEASAQETATLTIGTAADQVGELVEVPVTLTTNGTDPATILFSLVFDAAKLAFVETEVGPATLAAGKYVRTYESGPGDLRFIVTGNENFMGNGVLFWIVFEILPAAAQETLGLDGMDASAADPGGTGIAITVIDGSVQANCAGPAAPAGVTATQGQTDGVRVSWDAVDGAIDYRVYRALVDDVELAEPLSDWVPVLTVLDATAVPASATGGGCAGPFALTPVNYHYWVRARNSADCPGDFSDSAMGNRGAAKALDLKSATTQTVLPGLIVNDGLSQAAPDAGLAVRLTADTAIAPATVWAKIEAAGESGAMSWVADADGQSGWVVCEPDAAWSTGGVVRITAGARTAAGSAVEPVTREFFISGAVVSAKAMAEDVTPVANDALPLLDDSAGPVYAIGPQGLYPEARQVWVPIPDGFDADGLVLCYYQAIGERCGWYAAENVRGWLVSDEIAFAERGGVAYAILEVRHSANVQWALKPAAFSGASVVSVPRSAGDAFLMAGLALALAIAARRDRRRADA